MTAPAAALLPYLRALLEENQRINLTAIRDLEAAQVLHIDDSLAVGDLDLPPPTSCLDIGTGNGFPGIALKILWPQAHVVLLDRTLKKLRAIERVMNHAGIEGVDTIHADASQLPRLFPELRRTFNLITARAVAAPEKLAPLALPLLTRGGHLVLWLDERTAPTERLEGLQLIQVHEYQLRTPAERRRRLGVYTTP